MAERGEESERQRGQKGRWREWGKERRENMKYRGAWG